MCEFSASVQPSCTAPVGAPVTSEAGEEVPWHQTGDLLQIPHELHCSVITAASLESTLELCAVASCSSRDDC